MKCFVDRDVLKYLDSDRGPVPATPELSKIEPEFELRAARDKDGAVALSQGWEVVDQRVQEVQGAGVARQVRGGR